MRKHAKFSDMLQTRESVNSKYNCYMLKTALTAASLRFKFKLTSLSLKFTLT